MARSPEVTVKGRLMGDPRHTDKSGKEMKVAFLSVAVDQSYKDRKTDEWVNKTTKVDVVVNGPLKANVVQSVHKGDVVTATGQLEHDTRDNDGDDFSGPLRLRANDVQVSLSDQVVRIAYVHLDRENKSRKVLSREDNEKRKAANREKYANKSESKPEKSDSDDAFGGGDSSGDDSISDLF